MTDTRLPDGPQSAAQYRRILVVRRDNIGDLVLTTPLIHALRQRFPDAWIGALTNSYNAPVLAGSPDLDVVYAYDKAKHRPDRSRLAVAAGTARMLLGLRRQRLDLAILANPGYQRQAAGLVRWVGAREVLGFAGPRVTLPVNYAHGDTLHAAEDVFRLGEPLGIHGDPGPCRMQAEPAAVSTARARLENSTGPLIAVHISARRPRQQWPAERFAQVINAIHAQCGARFMLLWAPGAANDPRHPGDDAKAEEVRRLVGTAIPLTPMPTHSLQELAGALACADLMLCIDGGAMHVATALGKPVVALFGDSPVHRWRPWGVPHEVIAAPHGDLAQQDAGPVIVAVRALLARTAKGGA
jgi:ADP-heptose:LPS heptosyltransferase